MASWTEEATARPLLADPVALRPTVARDVLTVTGVPWVTLLLLVACGWVLAAAGGIRTSLSISGLLAYGAKATPLILDRGETWRLVSANFLHKDVLHLAFNAFAIWNVGGALERAVRPADYLALLIFTALGTTVASAVGADSISLGASGIAFGVLGAAASFGWKRRVGGRLRAHFGLRLLPWLLALFLAGLGSAGVDNWGHAGGLFVGTITGLFLAPRQWSGEGAARRLAGATGALLGTVSLGMFAGPSLPILGTPRDGPLGVQVQMPFGWRQAQSAPELVSYTNGLVGAFRGSATIVAPSCRGKPCACDRLSEAVTDLVRADLWRLADVGLFGSVHVGELLALPIAGAKAASVEGIVLGTEGQARIGATCVERDRTSIAVVVLEAPSTSNLRLETRIARTLRWPVLPQEP
jgi:membrane associated rhomboid family serine protease